jgi:hypothetical protein
MHLITRNTNTAAKSSPRLEAIANYGELLKQRRIFNWRYSGYHLGKLSSLFLAAAG